MPKVCLPFNNSRFTRKSKISKSFEISSLPIIDGNLKTDKIEKERYKEVSRNECCL